MTKILACVPALLLLAALTLEAQPFQGVGGGAGRTGAAGSTRQYYGPGTVGEAMITADPETRRLIVITDEETSSHVNQVIDSLDRPRPQVLINVVFLEVTYRDGSDIGIEGGIRRDFNNSTFGTFSNLFGLGPGSPGGGLNALPVPPGAGLYQIVSTDFQATIRAIAEVGKLEILSRPTILARNNQQATITVGQSVPLTTSTRFDTFGNAINSITYQDVGIILQVTPFIASEGTVEMIVAPEISALAEDSVPTGNGGFAPVINLRSADTVIVTPDGQTVMIGGMMQNIKTETVSKIPFLGDIPLLGRLFQRKVKTDAKTELIIFLTPHIVTDPSHLARLTNQERTKAVIAPKAFDEKVLNRFLDNLPVKDDKPSDENEQQP